MKYIQDDLPGSEEIRMMEFRSKLEALDPDELVDAYNRQARIGIVGVRAQHTYLLAMHEVFLKVFGKSPLNSKGSVLGIGGPIRLKGGGFVRVRKTRL